MTANTLAELGALHLSRPAVDAPPVVVAAWYERKATVLEHLADQGTPATQDPEPAADSAKNSAAGPGLARQSHNRSERNTMVEAPRVAVGSTEDRLAVYAAPDQVTYEPHALNALIATVVAREVAGRLRERAVWHRQAAANLAADAAEWHRIEAAELDALAVRELAGGESR
jgi:hypothetical protein